MSDDIEFDGDALFAEVTGGGDGDQGFTTSPNDGDGPSRDDQGRFAVRAESDAQPSILSAEAQPPAPASPQPAADQRMVDAMDALRTGQDALAAKLLSSVGTPVAAPAAVEEDPVSAFLADPNKFIADQVAKAQQGSGDRVQEVVDFYSQKAAVAEHGAERVASAYQAFETQLKSAPPQQREAILREIKASRDPYGEVVAWYGRFEEASNPQLAQERTVKRLLEDPAARALIEAELGQPAAAAAAPAAAQQPAQAPTNVIRIPPSLNRATAAASSAPGASDDLSDTALFSQVTARR